MEASQPSGFIVLARNAALELNGYNKIVRSLIPSLFRLMFSPRSSIDRSFVRPVRLLLRWSIAIGMPLLIYGCNGSKSLQNTLAPDPKLTSAPHATAGADDSAATNALPADFPTYPQAKQQSTVTNTDTGTISTWTTPDPIDLVYKFYQQQLSAQQWEVVTSPSDTDLLVAKQADQTVTISPTDKQLAGVTGYTIAFQGPKSPPSSPAASSPTPTASPPITATPSASPLPIAKSSATPPTATADYLKDLTQLGVLSSSEATAATKPVTRGSYARWLLAAYNRINSTKPTLQIKLATSDAKPAFQDVPITDPNFASIQALAEAGLIRSSLTGDATAVLFRPAALLTREQMILWKVPLDTHQALPSATLDAVKQTWGFQDAGKIDPQALRAVLADFQNGDRANIRRVFGFTTLFQPKKTVNVGEVAIALWYFGANSEGISAQEALQSK